LERAFTRPPSASVPSILSAALGAAEGVRARAADAAAGAKQVAERAGRAKAAGTAGLGSAVSAAKRAAATIAAGAEAEGKLLRSQAARAAKRVRALADK